MRHKRSECDWRRGVYRSRSGLILGVCKGLAEHLEFPVFWFRAIVVAAMVFSLPFIVLWVVAYFVLGLLMKPEPVVPFETQSDREFYDSYASSRPLALHRLRSTYESLERRIGRIESIVTARDFDWDKRLNESR